MPSADNLRRRALLEAKRLGLTGAALREAARIILSSTNEGEKGERLGALLARVDPKPKAKLPPPSALRKGALGWYGDYDRASAVRLTRPAPAERPAPLTRARERRPRSTAGGRSAARSPASEDSPPRRSLARGGVE